MSQSGHPEYDGETPEVLPIGEQYLHELSDETDETGEVTLSDRELDDLSSELLRELRRRAGEGVDEEVVLKAAEALGLGPVIHP